MERAAKPEAEAGEAISGPFGTAGYDVEIAGIAGAGPDDLLRRAGLSPSKSRWPQEAFDAIAIGSQTASASKKMRRSLCRSVNPADAFIADARSGFERLR